MLLSYEKSLKGRYSLCIRKLVPFFLVEITQRFSIEQTTTHKLQRKLSKFSKITMGCELEQDCASFVKGEVTNLILKRSVSAVNKARNRMKVMITEFLLAKFSCL